ALWSVLITASILRETSFIACSGFVLRASTPRVRRAMSGAPDASPVPITVSVLGASPAVITGRIVVHARDTTPRSAALTSESLLMTGEISRFPACSPLRNASRALSTKSASSTRSGSTAKGGLESLVESGPYLVQHRRAETKSQVEPGGGPVDVPEVWSL